MLAKFDLESLRADVDDEMTPRALAKQLGNAVKPIAVGPGLLAHLDAASRNAFLARWNTMGAAQHR